MWLFLPVVCLIPPVCVDRYAGNESPLSYDRRRS